MFELNLAVLPNYVLYLEGVQLSYIKVYVHIFSLWNSHKPCYITNAEFAKRTDLHRDTVINAITFLEKHNILKRVQKGTKRYLVQIPRAIETENEVVDNPENDSAKNSQGSELDRQGVGARPLKGSELDRHNNKMNKETKKSFSNSKETTGAESAPMARNDKKHDFADSMNQMANEARHIAQHEEIKKTEMPDEIRRILHIKKKVSSG